MRPRVSKKMKKKYMNPPAHADQRSHSPAFFQASICRVWLHDTLKL